ncbi:MAG TPA: hypothetical protein VFP78_20740, partial [Solirubrobacteraceae bacterium]|nr:hypothetical protein [Solirubrobacteraceae bacterium]
MRALAVIVAFLFLAVPAAAQDTVEQIASALRDDPVYVDPDAEMALSASEADAVRDRIDGDLYVAVLPASAGSAQELAAELRSRLGGSVGVIAGDSFRVDGTAGAERAADAAFDASSRDGAGAVLVGFVERASGGEPSGDGGDGGGGAGSLILLGAAGVGGAALLVRRRRRRQAEAVEFAEVKDNARDDLVALGDDIRALDLDVDMPGVPQDARADYERAVNAYDTADRSWRLARRPLDLEPVGSALEEGRWAMSSAKARLEGREPPERRSPCFFDPRHGPSSREVEWAPYGGAPRMVPACEADAQRVER